MKCLSEDEDLNLIPVKWIEEYHYCPRIIYFRGVLGLSERETALMEEGREAEEDEEQRERRRSTLLAKRREKVIRRWQKLNVKSDSIGLLGVIDQVVQTESGLKVVELKNTSARKLIPGYLYQAVAYGILAEEALKQPLRSIIIHHIKADKTFEVNVSDELREHVKWTVKRIRNIVSKEEMPKTKKVKECGGCGYYRFCRRL